MRINGMRNGRIAEIKTEDPDGPLIWMLAFLIESALTLRLDKISMRSDWGSLVAVSLAPSLRYTVSLFSETSILSTRPELTCSATLDSVTSEPGPSSPRVKLKIAATTRNINRAISRFFINLFILFNYTRPGQPWQLVSLVQKNQPKE